MVAMQGNIYKLCDFGSCVVGPQSCATKEDAAALSDLIAKSVTTTRQSPCQSSATRLLFHRNAVLPDASACGNMNSDPEHHNLPLLDVEVCPGRVIHYL